MSSKYLFVKLNCFLFCVAIIQCQQENVSLTANQRDYTNDLNSILLGGLISGASDENKQLITNQNLSIAVQQFNDRMSQIVQYNLDAIQLLAQTTDRCAIEPSRRSRQAIEDARDSAFMCLQNLSSNPIATDEYQNCLQNVNSTARTNIDLLKPDIDNCVQSVTPTQAPN